MLGTACLRSSLLCNRAHTLGGLVAPAAPSRVCSSWFGCDKAMDLSTADWLSIAVLAAAASCHAQTYREPLLEVLA